MMAPPKRVALSRFLVDAEELALVVEEDHARLGLSPDLARAIRTRTTEVRRIDRERRERNEETPTARARAAVRRVTAIVAAARAVAAATGNETMKQRLRVLRHRQPLRGQSVSALACGIDEHAAFVRTFERELGELVPRGTADALEALAREVLCYAADWRQRQLAARECTAARDTLLREIQQLARDVRAAETLAKVRSESRAARMPTSNRDS